MDQVMNTEERTKDIYERIPGYPLPPLVPLPPMEELVGLRELGIKPSPISRAMIKTFMALTGFNSFYKTLPENLEEHLRSSNLRQAGLFALINSASLALADDSRALSPAERAATLIAAAYQFHDDLMSGRLEPDKYKDQVLEMGQYPNLFSTSLTIDRGQARLFKSKRTDRITVILDGRYFLLQTGGARPEQIAAALQTLIDRVKSENQPAVDTSPGPITGSIHGLQLKTFGRLLQNPQNKEAFQKIRHSFLTLCLDLDDHPETYERAAFLTQSRNQHNRWYHASLQIVVFGNAKACTFCNFNAYIDGNPMMRGSAEIQKRATQVELNSTTDSPALPEPEELKWQISPEVIQQVRRQNQFVLDDQQATFEIPGLGKTFFQQQGLLPVPAFMVILDMAVKQLLGRHAPITQYLSMSKYRYLNLAFANAATPEVTAFTDYVSQPNFDPARAREMLQEAMESQRQAYRQARKYLPQSKIVSLFMATRTSAQKAWVTLLLGLAVMKLKFLGLYKPENNEIVVSHPDIRPEVPVVGRPGIKLPYIKYFGFHYQIFDDKTVITFMPSPKWKLSNGETFNAIVQNAEKFKKLFAQ